MVIYQRNHRIWPVTTCICGKRATIKADGTLRKHQTPDGKSCPGPEKNFYYDKETVDV